MSFIFKHLNLRCVISQKPLFPLKPKLIIDLVLRSLLFNNKSRLGLRISTLNRLENLKTCTHEKI